MAEPDPLSDPASARERGPSLALFAGLACAIGWLPHGARALGLEASPGNEPLGPALAALVTALWAGRAALRDWARALRRLRAPGWIYAIAVAAPIVLSFAAVGVNHAFGAPLPDPAALASGVRELPVSFALYLLFVGFGEEAGWTAFAGSRLLERHSFATAWAIAAALRTAWHLPLLWTGQLGWPLALAGNPAFAWLALWLYRRSGGCWFLAALWHAVLNSLGAGFLFAMVQGEDQARLGSILAASYVLAALATALLPTGARARDARASLPGR